MEGSYGSSKEADPAIIQLTFLPLQIMDAEGENSLALFPAKFRESMWIRRGSFEKKRLKNLQRCQVSSS
ncbi:hypothetical protein N665_0170s0044 [Sinapis alba]|nr:hypothetical protein N665_0170s0044 [Sinapis alba]